MRILNPETVIFYAIAALTIAPEVTVNVTVASLFLAVGHAVISNGRFVPSERLTDSISTPFTTMVPALLL